MNSSRMVVVMVLMILDAVVLDVVNVEGVVHRQRVLVLLDVVAVAGVVRRQGVAPGNCWKL